MIVGLYLITYLLLFFYKVLYLRDVVRSDYINLCHHRKLITQPTNMGPEKTKQNKTTHTTDSEETANS